MALERNMAQIEAYRKQESDATTEPQRKDGQDKT